MTDNLEQEVKSVDVVGSSSMEQGHFTLALLFESGNLVIRTFVQGLSSGEQATTIVSASPKLMLRDGWLWLEVKGRRSHRICCSYDCYCGDDCGGIDECGQWREGLDRSSSDDYFAAQLGIVDFLKLCSPGTDFTLVRSRVFNDRASDCIDKVELD